MKPLHLCSFIIVFIGAYFALSQLQGGEGGALQACVALILINACIGFYSKIWDAADLTVDRAQYACRAMAPACFTTYLFQTAGILGEWTNFIPIVITAAIAFSTSLIENEIDRQRYLQTAMFLNFLGQMFAAFQQGQDLCVILQSIILAIAFVAFENNKEILGLWNYAQYNFLSGIFLVLLGNKCALNA